jgi:hypothetical protein
MVGMIMDVVDWVTSLPELLLLTTYWQSYLSQRVTTSFQTGGEEISTPQYIKSFTFHRHSWKVATLGWLREMTRLWTSTFEVPFWCGYELCGSQALLSTTLCEQSQLPLR